MTFIFLPAILFLIIIFVFKRATSKAYYICTNYGNGWQPPETIPDEFEGAILVWDGEDIDICSHRLLAYNNKGKRISFRNKPLLAWHALPEIPSGNLR